MRVSCVTIESIGWQGRTVELLHEDLSGALDGHHHAAELGVFQLGQRRELLPCSWDC